MSCILTANIRTKLQMQLEYTFFKGFRENVRVEHPACFFFHLSLFWKREVFNFHYDFVFLFPSTTFSTIYNRLYDLQKTKLLLVQLATVLTRVLVLVLNFPLGNLNYSFSLMLAFCIIGFLVQWRPLFSRVFQWLTWILSLILEQLPQSVQDNWGFGFTVIDKCW